MSCCDLAAHRRLEFGLALRDEGDFEGAASVFEQAIELAPDWPEARFALADALQEAGRRDDAVAAFAAYLVRDPEDTMGATIRLALLGAAPQPDRLPDAYIKTLFDQYAPRFEESLVGRLSYEAPFHLREALDALWPVSAPEGRVLDLGCGTGLVGEALRRRAAWLEGIDLSPNMIEQARRKGVYDHLEVAEAVTALTGSRGGFDIVCAADVLIYLGDLAPLFAAVRRTLVPDGLFAFTVQRTEGDGFLLGGDHRYSHSRAYIERTAAQAGLRVRYLADAIYRTEKGRGVLGLVAILSNEQSLSATVAAALAGHLDPEETPVTIN